MQPPRRRRTLGDRLTTLVDRVDRACFRPSPDAFRPVDLGHTHPRLLATLWSAGTDPGPQLLDVVLDLTSGGVDPNVAPSSRLGVWALRFGRDSLPLGPGVFAPDFRRGVATAVTELVAHDPAPLDTPGVPTGYRVIYRSIGAIDRYSPARTRNAAAWKAAEFPARVLAAVASGCSPAHAGHVGHAGPPPGGARLLTVGSAVALVAQMAGRSLQEAGRRIAARPGWFVAIRVVKPDSPIAWPPDTAGFRPLVAPPGRFFADPFVIRSSTGALLFVEDAPVGGGPGRISVLELDSTGGLRSAPRIALERPTHLSYPFVFQDGDEWYMLPETAGTHRLELFRARRFPDDWELCAILLGGLNAFDPTLLRHDGRYWLFATVAEEGASPSDELCLYSSESLVGPWQPHPENPIVTDAQHARPAGRILVNAGVLFRPAQDCTGGYGRRIVLNRIDILNTEHYGEAPVAMIEPHGLAGALRAHTYTVDGGIEAIDGLRYGRRLRFGRRLKATVGRARKPPRPGEPWRS